MKKLLILLFAALIVLFGCSSDAEGVEQTQTDTLNVLVPYNALDPNNNNMDLVLTEETGQEVEYGMLPADDATTKLQLELTSESIYQMIAMWSSDFVIAAENGALLDLSPYLEQYGENIVAGIPEEAWAAVTDPETGAIYGIPVLGYKEQVDQTILVRTDILEQYGYAMPTNTDEFKEVTCGLAADGVATPYAVTNKMWGETTLRGAFNVPYEWNPDPETGELVYYGADPRFAEFVAYENELYECGAMGNDYETITSDDALQKFINGDAAFIPVPSWDLPKIADALAQAGLDYTEMTDVIIALEGPNGQAPTVQKSGLNVQAVWTIPQSAEQYAVQSIEWLNECMANDVQAKFLFGEPYDAETNPEGIYTMNEDGTINVYDENGDIFPAPESFFGMSVPLTYDAKVAFVTSEQTNRQEKGAEEDLAPEDAEAWYAYKAIEPSAAYGVTNPIGLTLFIPAYGDVAQQLGADTQDWAELTVAGATDESFEDFAASLDAQYGLAAVTEEVNAAVK